jgi:hypothetical protein
LDSTADAGMDDGKPRPAAKAIVAKLLGNRLNTHIPRSRSDGSTY